jgi:hypothetical protein
MFFEHSECRLEFVRKRAASWQACRMAAIAYVWNHMSSVLGVLQNLIH